VSRQILNSIQSGELAQQKVVRHPVFGFEVPMNCPGLDAKYLGSPSGEPVAALSAKFKANIEQFREKVDARVFDLGGPLSV
jgi:ATP-dependent phosphoenolpyruvate carboxykinase